MKRGWFYYAAPGAVFLCAALMYFSTQAVPAGVFARKIAAGAFHTCVALNDRRVRCWGQNASGQLAKEASKAVSLNASVSPLRDVADVAAGEAHTCALLESGRVRCWGNNRHGQLGDGATTDSSSPVFVTGINTAVDVAAGAFHTCAVLSSGWVRCWGSNEFGQLGTGAKYGPQTCGKNKSSPCSKQPEWVSGAWNAVRVSAGAFHTCALISDGTVRCWGDNSTGQLGNGFGGMGHYAAVPETVKGLNNVKSLAAGSSFHCALLSDKTVSCWGGNYFGQLGTGTGIGPSFCGGLSCSLKPLIVSGMHAAQTLAAGGETACAVLSDATMKCWGLNDYGQLGTDLHPDALSPCGWFSCSWLPVSVTGIHRASQAALGDRHGCALESDGDVKCWGVQGGGELGIADYHSLSACHGMYGKQPCSRIPISVSGIFVSP